MKNLKSVKIISENQNEKSKKHKIVLGIIVSLVVLPLVATAILAVGFTIYVGTVKVDASLLPTATAVPTFFDRYGNKIAYAEDGFLNPNEITDNLKYAFIATEDKRFYEHKGVDVVRIGGAILHNIKAGKAVEGASTITQQLVKNTHLSNERTLSRKIKEIAIATKLEKEYSKEEILSMYLSVIYFGNGVYGAKQAAKYYFSKDVDELTIGECATLAAIVKNPSKYSPNKNAEASISRRNLVIDKMYEQNYIALDVANNEKLKPLNVVNQNDELGDDELRDKDIKIYFDNVVKEVCEDLNITKYQLFNSGYKIYTNFDRQLQNIAVCQLNDYAESEKVDKIVILIDNSNGSIVAYCSTLGYTPKRQIGSTIKPILYSAAFDKNILSLATPVVDEPVDYYGYSPSNFGDKYYGNTLVKEAIAKSMNSIAIKTCDYLGIDDYFDCVKRFGLTVDADDKNYSLALGATKNGISPIEIASAYTAFADNGMKYETKFVRFVEVDGAKIFSNEVNMPLKVLSPSSAQLVNVALEYTVKNGTAKGLSSLPFEIAAKTGTSERDDGKNSDAWCVSYTPNYTLLVWHGSDEGMDEKGGGYPSKQALAIWNKLFDLAKVDDKLKNAFKATFAKDKILDVEVDLYSTSKKQKVVASTENVPIEYRKREYFAVDNLPSVEDSSFENILPPEFDVEKIYNGVSLSFNAEKIYEYDLYRTDLFGTRLIKHVDSKIVYLSSDSDIFENVQIVDRPWSFAPATYTLVCYLKNNPNIKNMSAKRVFVDISL